MSDVCQMIRPHHPDCGCALCVAGSDERCAGEACGTTEDNVRCCSPCGLGMEHEGFVVHWDNDKRNR